MSFKTLMIIKAVVCLGFGPILLIFPEQLLGLLGLTYCVGAAYTAREYGAVMIGTMIMTWIARSADISTARTAIIAHLFFYDAIALVVTVMFALSGLMGPLGWGIAFVYLFFTVGYGYFLLPQKNPA